MNIHDAFRFGAKKLAAAGAKYTEFHKSHGIDEYHWQILTSEEYWTAEQQRQMRSILANVLEVSLTIAGMPGIPLPGQYTAALIAEVVAPCNRMVACMKAPDTFDAAAAVGILGTHEVKPMSTEQMLSLVLAYSGGFPGEPQSGRLPKAIEAEMTKANKK